MTKVILVSLESGLHKLTSWPGWTDQDRVMIRDLIVQVQHLQRRQIQREIVLAKAGK